jgi:hypothetical protein
MSQVTLTSLFGDIALSEPYYHHKDCKCEQRQQSAVSPLSSMRLTKATMELATLAGVADPFKEGAGRLLKRMSGVHLSASSVQRATEATGETLGRLQNQGAGVGPEVEWDWYEDTSGAPCAYLSVDATGIGQQLPEGGKTDGKMVHLGLIFNPVPADWKGKQPPLQSRCVTSLTHLAGLERPLRMVARRTGVRKAQRLICLTDAGAGLEELVGRVVDDEEFAHLEVVFILDFYHAAEHVADFARMCREDSTDLTQRWCHLLKHQGVDALLEQLESLDCSDRPLAAEALSGLLNYIRNHRRRMDYPYYQTMGWSIGSGAIESMCKGLGLRMKGRGMRWGAPGSETLPRVRAMYLSDTPYWDHFWANLAI